MKTKEELAERMEDFLEYGFSYEWLYSPDGFMAVWDKLDREDGNPCPWFFTYGDSGCICGIFRGNGHKTIEAPAPDRYTAFYRAVDELMETLA